MNIHLPFRRGTGEPGRRPRRAARMTAALAALAVPALIVSTVAVGSASARSIFNIHISPNNTFALVLDVSGASTQPGAPVID